MSGGKNKSVGYRKLVLSLKSIDQIIFALECLLSDFPVREDAEYIEGLIIYLEGIRYE